mgnify:CR=1 FL=1
MDNGSLLVADSYYVVFRYLTVFHTLNGRCFLWMMALHFLMELPLSGKLLFDSYYEITSEWIEHDLRRRSLWWHHLMRDILSIQWHHLFDGLRAEDIRVFAQHAHHDPHCGVTEWRGFPYFLWSRH